MEKYVAFINDYNCWILEEKDFNKTNSKWIYRIVELTKEQINYVIDISHETDKYEQFITNIINND